VLQHRQTQHVAVQRPHFESFIASISIASTNQNATNRLLRLGAFARCGGTERLYQTQAPAEAMKTRLEVVADTG
jgi:hypothetical protein